MLSVVGLGTFKFLYLLLSDTEDDNQSGPKKNVSTLGMFSNVCLDNVYMNYLQNKPSNPPRKEEVTKSKSKKGQKSRGQSSKSTTGTDKRRNSEIPSSRRNSAPKVVEQQPPKASKDESDFQKQRDRRGSLQTGHLSPRAFSNTLSLGGIQEDEHSDEEVKPATPSTHSSETTVKVESKDDEEAKNTNDTDEVVCKHKKDTTSNVQDEELLLTLMKKNVKDSEYTPEQKALYDAHDTLWEEYQRRKAQRKKVGMLLRLKAKQLRGILGTLRGRKKESDLALKARSSDLQQRKSKQIKRNRRFNAYATVTDQNVI